MKHLLVPLAVGATALSAVSQATVDIGLLFPCHLIAPAVVTGTECDLKKFVSAADYRDLSPLHQQMVVRLANQVRSGIELPHACWFGNATPASMALWNAVMKPAQFNPTTRWSSTAVSGGGLNWGDPTVITYSFVPDGTTVPAANGSPAGPSTLFASFNAQFPSQQIWQDRIKDAMEDWGQLCGITYVFEPNDDGAQLASASGQVGVRGDVRISAKPIDGGFGILAYNYFPNNGDMVLDASDSSYYANSANNYRRLYNVIAHEHGHGIGISHVCPVNQTKLMEPFLSTAFNGPQFDDILTSQQLYGDSSEPNDSVGSATSLGALANGTDITSLVSIDDVNDDDWFSFSVASPKNLVVEVRPTGTPYLEGDQLGDGSCEPGVTFDPSSLRNLGFEIVDSNGTTVLASANSAPAGASEIAAATLAAAGNYFVHVFGGAGSAQLYVLELTISDGPPFAVTIPGGAPAMLPAEMPLAIDVVIVPGTGTADSTSGVLHTSVNGGAFTQSPLAYAGGNDYRGILPARLCLDTVDWYVSFSPNGGGSPVVLPGGAPAVTYASKVLTNVFTDDFESNLGWTVVNDAALTDGAWDRGTPVGGGDRGDPAVAAGGSGQCYLTDNVDGNSDVDGGATSLLSPVFDMSSYLSATISYAYWYTNNNGSNPGTDIWLIEISNNGGATWVPVLSTTASTTTWTTMNIDVANFVPLTSQVRMRFTASDPGTGAVVEAGVDAFRVDACIAPPTSFLPGACAGIFAASTIEAAAAPVAGTSLTFECSAVSQVAGTVITGFVLGFQQANSPLPSCGCTLVPTLNLLDVQLGSWASPAIESWSLPITLPPGTAGMQLYVQGFIAEVGAGTCTEAGLPLNTTDALRVTVQ